jgi:hypothetical protein
MRIFLLCLPSLLVACSSVKDITIPLDHTFKQEAQQFNLKRPQEWVNEKSFDQDVNNYRIHDVKVITTLNQKHLLEQSQGYFSSPNRNISDLVLKLLFNRELNSQLSSRYEVEKEREFAFNVSTASFSNQIIQSSCLIQSINENLERSSVQGSSKPLSSSSNASFSQKRLFSSLQCEYKLGEQIWNLSFSQNNQQLPVIELSQFDLGNKKTYQLNQIYGQHYLINQEWRSIKDEFDFPSGFKIHMDKQQVAAFSFSEPKIWLNTHSTTHLQAFLFAASYSLILYDNFDPGWRRRFMNDRPLR